MKRLAFSLVVPLGLSLAGEAAADLDGARKPWLARQRGVAEPTEATTDDEHAEAEVSTAEVQRLYLRAALGAGLFSASTGSDEDERSFSGRPLSLAIELGASLGKNLRLGLALIREQILGLESEDELIDGDEPDLEGTRFAMQLVGPFLSLTEASGHGFYGFFQFGYGSLSVSGVDTDDPNGLALAVGAGHDWPLDDDWALGVMARLLYAPLTSEEIGPSVDVTVLIPSLAFSVSYR